MFISYCSDPPEEAEESRQEAGREEEREVVGGGTERDKQGLKEVDDVRRDSHEDGEQKENGVLEGESGTEEDIRRSGSDPIGPHQPCMSPDSLPPADLVSLSSQEGVSVSRKDEELIAPPDTFGCDDSATATPTPQPEAESMASGTITPRTSPCGGTNTPVSPLSPSAHPHKESTPPAEVS